MQKKKILIIGHKAHGKDTVAEILTQLYGFNYKSSSEMALDIFLMDRLKQVFGITSREEYYQRKEEVRAFMYQEILKYNTPDRAKLAKEIMTTNDIYVGMRDKHEIASCINQGVFDLVIGVYNPGAELEGEESFNIDVFEHSHVIIINDGKSFRNLRFKLSRLKTLFFK